MQGRIAWFRPDTGEGLINTEAGMEVPFRVQSDELHLEGGDIVEFDSLHDGRGIEACNLRLIEKWVDRLNQQHLPLVRQLFATVRFSRS
ncbi:MAG: hypothetical protein ACE5K7_08580 [Phycisphaerae bacterium]